MKSLTSGTSKLLGLFVWIIVCGLWWRYDLLPKWRCWYHSARAHVRASLSYPCKNKAYWPVFWYVACGNAIVCFRSDYVDITVHVRTWELHFNTCKATGPVKLTFGLWILISLCDVLDVVLLNSQWLYARTDEYIIKYALPHPEYSRQWFQMSLRVWSIVSLH